MRAVLLAGVVALGWVGTAAAAPIIAIYDFTGTFNTGPNPTISGTAALAYDPASGNSVTVNGFSSQALAGYAPVTAALEANPPNGYILAVGTNTGPNSVGLSLGADSFGFLLIVDASGNVLSNGGLGYTVPGYPSFYRSTSLVITREAAAVPEPASLALLSVGILGLGLIRRHRAT